MVSHRSTKGASKARRDHINHEIRHMRALLPISQEDQERLSYLHSMAAICTYIRKSVLFQGFPSEERPVFSPPYEAFLPALHGFILVTTARGKLVYVSENVAEYLGLSMVDVLQGDTLYDMVERSDVDVVKSNLDTDHNSASERSFICRMQTSKGFKLQHGGCCSMLVRGSFRSFSDPRPSSSARPAAVQPLFVAVCTPTANRLTDADGCRWFSSVHGPDMTFSQLSRSVFYFLGYSAEEMSGRSWYGLVHPEDLSVSADSHRSLVQAEEGFQVQMVLRLQRKDLSWTWIYTRANKDSDFQSISCTNFVISETEARFLQEKISSDAFKPSSVANSCHFASQPATQTPSCKNTKSLKRQRTSNSQSEEPSVKKRRESEQDVYFVSFAQGDGSPVPSGDGRAFTPPYTPPSSCSPLQKEELSRDLLMDQLLSSPESSPSYYSYPEAALTCHRSPSDSLPAAVEQTFDQGGFAALGADSPASSPTYDFPSCPSDARLVPDCLSVSDTCESPVDCALHQDDFSLLEQPQGDGLVHVHHVPEHAVHSVLLTPSQSPASHPSFQYSEREQAEISILAQQISSLASSFDMYHTLNPLPAAGPCTWPRHPPPPPPPPPPPHLESVSAFKRQLVLDDGMFDSILNDLDLVTRKSGGVCPFGYEQSLGSCELDRESLGLSPSIEEDSAEQFTTAMGENNGLHQLNCYMQSSLRQDGLAEENLY